MKTIIVLLTFFTAVSSLASVAILDAESYFCTDGKKYNVLRHYWGGWGPGQWKLAAFCNIGILKQSSYQARVMNARDAHEEVASCQDEDTPEVRKCYQEFIQLNGSRGIELAPIIHGDKAAARMKSENQIQGFSTKHEPSFYKGVQ